MSKDKIYISLALSLSLITASCSPARDSNAAAEIPASQQSRHRISLIETGSIGVPVGADQYMFGRVTGVALEGGLVYVVDSQVPTVRVFGPLGDHRFDIGAAGGGPGEFSRPNGIWVGPAGRLAVLDSSELRLNLYSSSSGEFLGSFNTPPAEARYFQPWERAVGIDGTMYSGRVVQTGDSPGTLEVLARTAGAGVVVAHRAQLPSGEGEDESALAEWVYSPKSHWAISSTGALITGYSGDSTLRITRAGGEVVDVRLPGLAVTVPDEEVEWHLERQAAIHIREGRSPRPSRGPRSATKPRFRVLFPDANGRVWVLRDLESERIADCDEMPRAAPDVFRLRPCWRTPLMADVFEEDGSYVGRVDPFLSDVLAPTIAFAPPRLFIEDNSLVVRAEDAEGTVLVKRYEIVWD